MSASRYSFGEREEQNLEDLAARALAEDLGQGGDITSEATIPGDAWGRARLVARAPGVLSGLPAIELLIRKFEPNLLWEAKLADGDRLESGSLVGRLAGPMRALLAMERTALNFLQRLSGIASLTARYVAAVGRHERGDLRHAQDDSWLAVPREVRSAVRWRSQSSIRTLRRCSYQGQPS